MFYFYRDINHDDNFEDDKSFHSSGLVVSIYGSPDKPSFSGKDLCVVYIHPFNFTHECEWRAYNEVELFEVSEDEHQSLQKAYQKFKSIRMYLLE